MTYIYKAFDKIPTGGYSAGQLHTALNSNYLANTEVLKLSKYLYSLLTTGIMPNAFTLSSIVNNVFGISVGVEDSPPESTYYGDPHLVFTFKIKGFDTFDSSISTTKIWFKHGPFCLWGLLGESATRCTISVSRKMATDFGISFASENVLNSLWILCGIATKNLATKTSPTSTASLKVLKSSLYSLPIANLVRNWPADVWYANKNIIDTPLHTKAIESKNALYYATYHSQYVEQNYKLVEPYLENGLRSFVQLLNNAPEENSNDLILAVYYLARSIFGTKIYSYAELVDLKELLLSSLNSQVAEVLTRSDCGLRLVLGDTSIDDIVLSYYTEEQGTL
jgi:hypothetical protein